MALHLRGVVHLLSHTRESSFSSFPAPCPLRRPASSWQCSSPPIKLCSGDLLRVRCVADGNSGGSEVQGAVDKNMGVQYEE